VIEIYFRIVYNICSHITQLKYSIDLKIKRTRKTRKKCENMKRKQKKGMNKIEKGREKRENSRKKAKILTLMGWPAAVKDVDFDPI
jgi:uncharacterized coiled-coil DUF342 family protein